MYSCAQAYRKMRASGTDDLGTILIAIATDLETFDFNDTFTGNFEVANKVSEFGCARCTMSFFMAPSRMSVPTLPCLSQAIELLMSNDGQEVCCQGADDVRRLETLGTAKSRQAEAESSI